jgi:hypothetical protein
MRTYYNQRTIYGQKIVYFVLGELANDWSDTGTFWMYRCPRERSAHEPGCSSSSSAKLDQLWHWFDNRVRTPDLRVNLDATNSRERATATASCRAVRKFQLYEICCAWSVCIRLRH